MPINALYILFSVGSNESIFILFKTLTFLLNTSLKSIVGIFSLKNGELSLCDFLFFLLFKIIVSKISTISGLFKDWRKNRKYITSLKCKNLIHNQILQEIKKTNHEQLLMLQERKDKLKNELNKIQKKVQKYKAHFNEIEIYIRRECQAYDNYRDLYMHFCMNSFIVKNNSLLNLVKIKKNQNKSVLNLINIVKSENNEYKNGNNYNSNNINNVSNSIVKKTNKKNLFNIHNITILLKDKNEYFEKYIEEFKVFDNNLLYYQHKFYFKDNGNIINDKSKKNFNKKGLGDICPISENPDSSELSSESEN